MTIKLPSRYEDLDEAFRGRLRPVPRLIATAQSSLRSMTVSGGLRFLPLYGASGSGKTCAARELGTHLPQAKVFDVPREALESLEALKEFMREAQRTHGEVALFIALVDQYEEVVATRGEVPRQFVEWVSLLDRNPDFTNKRWLYLWLTTSKEFQNNLQAATSRNSRILAEQGFELPGPSQGDWTNIIEETFEFHNGKPLADFGMVRTDIDPIVNQERTIGAAIQRVGNVLAEKIPLLQDISKYQVVMLWPVTDGQRISTVLRFVDPRDGYKLDWNAWYRQLNEDDRRQLPLAAYNRARLYFDIRLVPVAAADLQPLCRALDDDSATLHQTYLDRFSQTHYVSIVKGTWDSARYAPLRERSSGRASEARDWYSSVTTEPTKVGRRLARILQELRISAKHEVPITSPHGSIRADVLVDRPGQAQDQVLTELKLFSPENTMPSSIRDAVQTTLRRHAQFAGFLQRQ